MRLRAYNFKILKNIIVIMAQLYVKIANLENIIQVIEILLVLLAKLESLILTLVLQSALPAPLANIFLVPVPQSALHAQPESTRPQQILKAKPPALTVPQAHIPPQDHQFVLIVQLAPCLPQAHHRVTFALLVSTRMDCSHVKTVLWENIPRKLSQVMMIVQTVQQARFLQQRE